MGHAQFTARDTGGDQNPPVLAEEWRTVPGYPIYQASSLGRIRNQQTDHILKLRLSEHGYWRVELVDSDGQRRNIGVHRLLCMAWNGPPPFPKAQAAHLDGSRTNNVPDNIVWASNRENCAHREQHGRTARKLTEEAVREIALELMRPDRRFVRDIAQQHGVSTGAIEGIKRGRNWRRITAEVRTSIACAGDRFCRCRSCKPSLVGGAR